VPERTWIVVSGLSRSGRPRTQRVSLDLLEVFETHLGPPVRFGLIHLSSNDYAVRDDTERIDAIRTVARRLSTPFLTRREVEARDFETVLSEDGYELDLQRPFGPRGSISPIGSLCDAFGWTIAETWRSRGAYPVTIVGPAPSGSSRGEDGDAEDASLLAFSLAQPSRRERAHENFRVAQVGPFAACVGLHGSAFVDVRTARSGDTRSLGDLGPSNLRSYWGESLLLAVVQQELLEAFGERLAALGHDPTAPAVGELFGEWLTFRNVLWWSSPSVAATPPRELVAHYRAALGSDELFAELDGDFDRYVTESRRRSDEVQAHALDNLQVYGAGIAVIGSLATLVAFVVGTDGNPLALTGAAIAIVACGLLAALSVARRLGSR
jgi:hypothetical protein